MIWVLTWVTRSMIPWWVIVSSVLNEACAIFSRGESPCTLMMLAEWLLPDSRRQKPLESERDGDLPPSSPPFSRSVWSSSISYIQMSSQKQTRLILWISGTRSGLPDAAAGAEWITGAVIWNDVLISELGEGFVTTSSQLHAGSPGGRCVCKPGVWRVSFILYKTPHEKWSISRK